MLVVAKEAMLTFVTYSQAKHSVLRVVEQLQSKWEGWQDFVAILRLFTYMYTLLEPPLCNVYRQNIYDNLLINSK